MTNTTIPREYWEFALEEISLCSDGARVSLTILGEGNSAINETRSGPFCGLAYDPKHDALIFGSHHLKHLIIHPKQIDLTHHGVTISAVAILGADDRRHILDFTPPLALGTRDYGDLPRLSTQPQDTR